MDFLRENALPCHLYEMARSLPVGIIQGTRSNTLFRFLHRLIKQLCVSHKSFLINTLDLLAVVFASMILSLIIEGWLDTYGRGISANHEETLAAGVPALKMALAPSREVLPVASDAPHNETRQAPVELDGEDSKFEIWSVRNRASLPVQELWFQGGLVDN